MEEVKTAFRIDEYHGSYYYERKDVETSNDIFPAIIGKLDTIIKSNDNKIDKLHEVKFFVYEYDNKKEKTGKHRLTLHCKVLQRRKLLIILRGTHSETGSEGKIATLIIPEERWRWDAEDIIDDLRGYSDYLRVDQDIDDGCCCMMIKKTLYSFSNK